MRSTALSVAALGALVVVLAGCGGGGHKASTTTTTAAAAATTAKQTATTAKSAATASALSGLATSANCRQLADLGAKFSDALKGTDSNDVKKEAALLKEFASKTPSAIRPCVS